MVKYIIAGSSLYPIDFAAGLYAGICNRTATFQLYFNEVAELPTSTHARKYVSRSALPLIDWELDKKNVWRQIHYPLENLKENELLNSILFVSDSICKLLQDSHCLKEIEEVSDRAQHIVKTLKNQLGTNIDHVNYSCRLLEYIYSRVLNRPVAVDLLGKYRLGEVFCSETINFLNRINKSLCQNADCILKGIKGGFVEIRDSDLSSWKRYHKFSYNNGEIHFFDNEDTKYSLRLGNPENTCHFEKSISFRFGGTLEVAFLQEFGTLVHLPWYCDARYFTKDVNDKYFGYEFISPISSSSIERVSDFSGGKGWRLNPSGYSLIEYEEPIILSFIQGVLRDQSISFAKLDDWKNLITNYPIVDQKIAKHQNTSRLYRTILEQNKCSNIRKGRFDIDFDYLFCDPNLSVVEYGKFFIDMISLLSTIKEWASPFNNITPKKNDIDYLQKNNLIDNRNFFKHNSLINLIEKTFEKTYNWLILMGIKNVSELNKSQNKFLKGVETIKVCSPILILSPSKNSYNPKPGIGLIIQALREIADFYYSFASFAIATLFKANVVVCYLLLGGSGYEYSINKVIEKRKEKPFICYDYKFLITE